MAAPALLATGAAGLAGSLWLPWASARYVILPAVASPPSLRQDAWSLLGGTIAGPLLALAAGLLALGVATALGRARPAVLGAAVAGCAAGAAAVVLSGFDPAARLDLPGGASESFRVGAGPWVALAALALGLGGCAAALGSGDLERRHPPERGR